MENWGVTRKSGSVPDGAWGQQIHFGPRRNADPKRQSQMSRRAGLAIAGVGIIAECYACDHLVSKMVAFDLMRNRVAISERVRLIRTNDFDALSVRAGNC